MKAKGFVWFLILAVGAMIPAFANGNPPAVIKAINCGGPEVTTGGITYEADLPPSQLAIGGSPYSNVVLIADTTDDVLYQTERFGVFSYTISVPVLPSPASYLVTLKFAEIYPYAFVGSRIFTVVINGVRVIMDFDILAWTGDRYKAFDAHIPVEVPAGGNSIEIEFFGEKCCLEYQRLPKDSYEDYFLGEYDQLYDHRQHKGRRVAAKCETGVAKVNAILVTDNFAFSPTVVQAINSGGDAVFADGISYDADEFYVLGKTYSTDQTIDGASLSAQPLYQTERYGDFSYAIPVTPGGTYNVLLKFAEIYQFISQGARVIAVDIEGKRVITGLDLDSEFGAYQAYDFFVPFPVTVKDGILNIDFFTEECCLSKHHRQMCASSEYLHKHHSKLEVCEVGQAKVSGILVYTQPELE
jgi:hypothetical protein